MRYCQSNKTVKQQYIKKQCSLKWKTDKQGLLDFLAQLIKPNSNLIAQKFYITAKERSVLIHRDEK